MDANQLAKRAEGIYSIELLQELLDVSKRTAVNYISKLRKKGFVKTTRGRGKKRLYTISPIKLREGGNPGFYETLNNYSKIKIVAPCETRIHGKKISVEETIIWALQQKSYRLIIAAMSLFNHVKNWPALLMFARKENAEARVGALYDLTKTVMKVKRIDKRTESALQKSICRTREKELLINDLKQEKEFAEIGKKWNVIIGLTKQDLMRLKE
jgi:DNA-binding transcriptional ArsR family regulator